MAAVESTRDADRAGPGPDRAGAVRAALVRLVARQGFHGTSMSAIATEAGVATGTAYVHYASKDDLVFAAYIEVKDELGRAATAGVDADADPATRFRQLWFGVFRHLRDDPARARFLVQVDSSPYAEDAHARAMAAVGDRLLAEATRPDMAARLAPLPPFVLYDMAVGPAVRLVASGHDLKPHELETLCESCWRAVAGA